MVHGTYVSLSVSLITGHLTHASHSAGLHDSDADGYWLLVRHHLCSFITILCLYSCISQINEIIAMLAAVVRGSIDKMKQSSFYFGNETNALDVSAR